MWHFLEGWVPLVYFVNIIAGVTKRSIKLLLVGMLLCDFEDTLQNGLNNLISKQNECRSIILCLAGTTSVSHIPPDMPLLSIMHKLDECFILGKGTVWRGITDI